ncbi:hypothetical protein H310_11940 [Aphanomyces invadans]|uniref:PH domain-containing protein n=1 Tax=Aphanomyces invadans TaxID=157072 RepID=A0A024TKY6_9STRA|nr:hypothetical protein H310_11940 [Aphanomyces invadans]ETV94276.1 hypothetical protein H310_11940 [Aphanomyces invadans]|eukprot:XP_008877038.1 hypothetical protein H310_11940 [Aphanomyces invadans]
MKRRPRLDSSVSLELPPPEMLQRSVTSVTDDSSSSPTSSSPASPNHRRNNSRQYSLPVLNIGFSNFKFAKEDHKRSPSPSKSTGSPIQYKAANSPATRHRRTPTKSAATLAFQRIAEDMETGHASDPGPSCRSGSTDSDDEYTRTRRPSPNSPSKPSKHITSYSLYLPDSCSGLKDQFLRIKERFTKPAAPTTAVNDATPGGQADDGPATQSPKSQATFPDKPKTNSWRGLDPNDRRRLTADSGGWIDPRDLLDPTRNEEIAMKPMELMHELAKLNASAKKLFADDPWSHGAERWVLEGSHLRGYMTCWTIERGGELVVMIAQSMKSLNASIHPDISLQWIGRQLYGLTIQLPLTRKELSMEHITVASGIDVALAKMLSLPDVTSWPRSATMAADMGRAPMTTTELAGLQDRSKALPRHESVASFVVTATAITSPTLSSRSSTSSSHHVRSQSTDSAPSILSGSSGEKPPVSSKASASFVRSLSTDLSIKVPSSSRLNDTKWQQQQLKLFSGRSDGQSDGSAPRLAVGPIPPTMVVASTSTASTSTKTYHALAAPTTTTTLFEDDPFQRCTPDKTGWLKKRSSGLNAWQLRWFELKGNRLYYFKSEKDGIPRGAIVLDKVHCVKDDQSTGNDMPSSLTIAPSCGDFICMLKFSNRLTYHSYSRRSCTLRVEDGETTAELNSWINAICRASFHCYLALPPSPQGKVKQLQAKKSDNEMYQYSSFQYLRETDPLLWEINPLDQTAIRKKAAAATSATDYSFLFTKFAQVLKNIVLPRPRPISIEQTLRDIIPELFLINNILYGGGETESIDDIFEVLEGYVRRFAATHDECVHIVSAILQACARTIAGGDSYFVVRTLLGSPSMVIRPAHNHGMPIVIDISSAKPTLFTITLQSVFMFHTVDEVERMEESDDVAPTCRVQTLHVQEIDFEINKSTRHLKIRQLLNDEDERPMDRNSHSSRSIDHDYGALLDGLG